MLPMARLMDQTFGVCVGHEDPISIGGFIITSQSKVFINGLPSAVISDTVMAYCGHIGTIVSGSLKVFVNGIPAVRIVDSFVGTYSGTIISGSNNVFCA